MCSFKCRIARSAIACLILTAMLSMPFSAQGQEVLPTITVEGDRTGNSLTVPTPQQAERAIQYTPGSVQVVPDTLFKN